MLSSSVESDGGDGDAYWYIDVIGIDQLAWIAVNERTLEEGARYTSPSPADAVSGTSGGLDQLLDQLLDSARDLPTESRSSN